MGVIIHSSLLKSIIAVKAISSWLIMVQLKITGGRFTIFGAYGPHDGTELSLREKFYEELTTALVTARRAGPCAVCGDLNTAVKYRFPDEANVFGPHLFDAAGAPPRAQRAPEETTNRDLLSVLCQSESLSVANTFLANKSDMQRVSFFDRRLHNWATNIFERRWHR